MKYTVEQIKEILDAAKVVDDDSIRISFINNVREAGLIEETIEEKVIKIINSDKMSGDDIDTLIEFCRKVLDEKG